MVLNSLFYIINYALKMHLFTSKELENLWTNWVPFGTTVDVNISSPEEVKNFKINIWYL